MRIINDPFAILAKIVEKNYPEADCDVYFGSELTDGLTSYGCTWFPEDKSQKPFIEVHTSLRLEDATEIFAHELAHLIVGPDADHGEAWETVFEDLKVKFDSKISAILAADPTFE